MLLASKVVTEAAALVVPPIVVLSIVPALISAVVATNDEVVTAAALDPPMIVPSIVPPLMSAVVSTELAIVITPVEFAIVADAVPSAADIDAAMVHGYRHPIGPLRLTDLVGLDVRLAIAQYLHEKLGSSQFEPPKLLQEMVRDGLLGKKSGKGFYCWKE